MTEVNGLRLALRGLVAGLAGGYVWAAIAMALAAGVHGDPLLALRPFATAASPVADTPELAFVIGLLLVQLGGGLVGIVFAYFFARFFTVRATLLVAAPVVAFVAWVIATSATLPVDTVQAAPWIGLVATLGYGAMLGMRVPLRGEVTRQSGSPVT